MFKRSTQTDQDYGEIVEEVKLPGVVINKDLKWDRNTNYLVKKQIKR